MKNILLTLTTCFVLTLAASGQKRETLIDGLDLTTPKVCGLGTYGEVETFVGTVMKRDFDRESETIVSGFVLRDQKDRRYYINVDVEWVSDHFSGNTMVTLSEALMKGNSLRVKADLCGKIYTARRVTVLKM